MKPPSLFNDFITYYKIKFFLFVYMLYFEYLCTRFIGVSNNHHHNLITA
jgi:hypothetical protein